MPLPITRWGIGSSSDDRPPSVVSLSASFPASSGREGLYVVSMAAADDLFLVGGGADPGGGSGFRIFLYMQGLVSHVCSVLTGVEDRTHVLSLGSA
jgi:hypothetical protein